MEADVVLQPGDELHCPHCHQWHVIVRSHDVGTDYTRRMLYWDCRGQRYYAGQIGFQSRYDVRRSQR